VPHCHEYQLPSASLTKPLRVAEDAVASVAGQVVAHEPGQTYGVVKVASEL
jgi:hypothetical protein